MKYCYKTRLCAFALFCLSAAVWAQDDENSDLPIQSNWNNERSSIYSPGDKTFNISLGALFPLFFTGGSYNIIDNKINIGGTIAIAYNYFLDSKMFVGGDVQFSFSSTIGEHFLFVVPIAARVGYQFVWRRFEFPLSAHLGVAPQLYSGYSLFGMFFKLQQAAYFKFNPEWSFGLNGSFWWMPEWTKDPNKNAYGHFFELTASARFHF
ncbi:MAG: hypothetical protein LBC77_05970 [Spirochaetaceae bacterium]|jgi:hypothetical protein|nr:hypothetical protein [Spirochaetaceae bacterium]